MRAYAAAMFLLVAHAFYKALMFLGAGSVMHGMHDETDMKKMGGLLQRMPITGVTFVIGAFALAGVPPLAGFFAKDQILEIANHTGRHVGLRAWHRRRGHLRSLHRAVDLPNFLRERRAAEAAKHAHESPPAHVGAAGRACRPGRCWPACCT